MRPVLFLGVFTCVVFGQDFSNMANMPKYDERYDYLDVDAIFTNKRLVRNYVECLINAQRCTPEGKALKRLLPEALRTKCIRCTERQKKTAVKIIKRLKYEYPDEWAKLSSRWDPTGDFTRYFEVFLAKEHFNTIPGSGNEIPSLPPRTNAPRDPSPTPFQTPSASPPLATSPEPDPAPTVQAGLPAVFPSTPPRPIILNRFGDGGELMVGSSSSAAATPRPTMPVATTMKTTTSKPATTMPTRPTIMTWAGAASNTLPTRFPLRPTSDIPLPYSTAITIIDQIGYKIIRTTELVTDLFRNTVRAVVGR